MTVMRSEIQPDQRLIRRLGELAENIIESVNDEKETDAACEDQINPVQNRDNYGDTKFGSRVTFHTWLSTPGPGWIMIFNP